MKSERLLLSRRLPYYRELGPGLLESVYEVALAHVLREHKLNVARQTAIPVQFRGIRFDEGFRADLADLIVNDKIIIELKSVERVTASHKKQVQTYLRLLTGLKLGYLLNFGESLMKDGITRCVNGLKD